MKRHLSESNSQPNVIKDDLSDDNKPDPLYWDDIFGISLALRNTFPNVDLSEVSLGMICRWAIELPGFQDDPEIVNQEILDAIYQEWYEEVNPI